MNRRPIRFGVPTMAPFTPSIGVKRLLQRGIHHAVRQGPTQSRALEALQGLPHGRGRQAKTPRDIARWNRNRKLQTNNLAHMAHCNSLRWHRSLLGFAKDATLEVASEDARRPECPGGIIPLRWAASSRNGGRHHSVTVGDIISFWWAAWTGISTDGRPPGYNGPPMRRNRTPGHPPKSA